MINWLFRRKPPMLEDANIDEVAVTNGELIPNIAVTAVSEERPRFKRIYRVIIKPGITLIMDAKTYPFMDRSWNAELSQGGSKSVWFCPHNVAEKILDRELVPIIERHIKLIFELDKEFVNSRPDTYTDETGQIWVKKV